MMYVGLTTQSMTQGLTQAWGLVRAICPGLKDICVREEAFCQGRAQLSLGFWRTLWDRLRQRYEDQTRRSTSFRLTVSACRRVREGVHLTQTPGTARR